MQNKLKIARATKNVTQEDLALAVNVSRQSIYAIEISKYVPSTVLALKIAKYFEMKVEDLFMLEEED
jgi:putative transcriptional regulator